MPPLPVLGRYQFERRLGAGGMGDVWLARHEDYPGPLVVKRLHAFLAQDPRSIDRFFDEMLLMRLIDHRNVVRLIDGGRIGDTYFLTMEYVDGLTLRDSLLANGAALQPALAVELIAQACAGLAHAHGVRDEDGKPMRMVHRDISPDNLMVDHTGAVRVLDFGIARAACSLATTQVSVRRGKVRFCAPEYLEDGVVDPRIDVYSMGATLFALCTGHAPFDSCSEPVPLMRMVCRVGLLPANELRPDLPEELVAVISDATRLEPDRRTASIALLGERLQALRELLPPPSPAQIGRMVGLWKTRLASPLPPRAPSLGQLELTTAQPPILDEPRAPPSAESSPANVHVSSHPLDMTVVLPLSETLRREAQLHPTPQPLPCAPGPSEPKVIVSPELEGVEHPPDLRKG
ncbi:MAG: protein kinase [Deltaproteobacteria bacterium]|nr:protein kinase [Deltaproteobacteria bacterium]